MTHWRRRQPPIYSAEEGKIMIRDEYDRWVWVDAPGGDRDGWIIVMIAATAITLWIAAAVLLVKGLR